MFTLIDSNVILHTPLIRKAFLPMLCLKSKYMQTNQQQYYINKKNDKHNNGKNKTKSTPTQNKRKMIHKKKAELEYTKHK